MRAPGTITSQGGAHAARAGMAVVASRVAKCAVEMEGIRAEAAWAAQASGVVEWACDAGWVRE